MRQGDASPQPAEIPLRVVVNGVSYDANGWSVDTTLKFTTAAVPTIEVCVPASGRAPRWPRNRHVVALVADETVDAYRRAIGGRPSRR